MGGGGSKGGRWLCCAPNPIFVHERYPYMNSEDISDDVAVYNTYDAKKQILHINFYILLWLF
jgi:hypothetical protein